MIMNNLGLVEAALTFLIVVGFCVYQYVSVSRSLVRDRAKAEAEKSASAGHAEGQHPLHDRRDEPVE
jgi:hypothetical protein